jgi:hypothetical protein
MNPLIRCDRRSFLSSALAAPLLAAAAPARRRTFQLCISPDGLDQSPELISLARDAGITTIWVCGFMYGHWYFTPERVQANLARVRKAGMRAEVAFVPLGHPGDSLGAKTGEPPLVPPPHWRQCVWANGSRHWGNSLHPPATEENAAALRRFDGLGVTHVFLDDDYRLAVGPGVIGGCFCDDHWRQFAALHGYSDAVKTQLLDDVRRREPTPVLRNWVDFQCSELTASFRTIQAARPAVRLGIMVMYLGAEKAGIRLADYRDAPFRVGEMMFADKEFDPLKGKTDELFSALFHRRFASPELAYSESTAFPADKLSAPNLAAKLVTSTLADVRTTMLMSGFTPFPLTHWQTLKPAMHHNAAIHDKVAGHKPTGPFKHYWGEWSRLAGRDRPFSLFLASGIPFEVCDVLPKDGWTFLSDDDARANLRSPGTELVTRAEVPETLDGIFALKHRILARLNKDVPYIEEDSPAVCSWLPTARTVLVWNLEKEPRSLTLRHAQRTYRVSAGPLGLAAVTL